MKENTTKLAINDFSVKRRYYENAISCQFDNRRVIVTRLDDGFGFEFYTMENPSNTHVVCENLRGKVAYTRIRLSKEAAEVVMLSLAEMMGLHITNQIQKNEKYY